MAGLFINVSYIVVPIFLMLNNWDKTLRQLTGGTFFLNNLFCCWLFVYCVYGASVYDLSFVRIFQIFGKRF